MFSSFRRFTTLIVIFGEYKVPPTRFRAWREARPESPGLDCRVCAMFARQMELEGRVGWGPLERADVLLVPAFHDPHRHIRRIQGANTTSL